MAAVKTDTTEDINIKIKNLKILMILTKCDLILKIRGDFMDWNVFCNKIFSILKPYSRMLQLEAAEERITFKIEEIAYEYTIEEFNTFKEKMSNYSFEPFIIATPQSYETLISNRDANRFLPSSFDDPNGKVLAVDNESNLTYIIRQISDELLWYIIDSVECERKIYQRLPIHIIDSRIRSLKNKTLFNVIKTLHRFPLELYIKSLSVISFEKFHNSASSFLFNFAYNYDCVFKNIKELDDIFPQRNLNDLHHSRNYNELEAPKLLYKHELTEQYYMAISSEEPFVKFIGFYHIIEHFYDDVYSEELINSVKNIIQHPGFSSKRSKDIVKIVDLIQKKTKQGKEEFIGNESEALELTLKKFISVPDLVLELNNIDSEIVDYYKNHEVSFSKGNTINLTEHQNEKLFSKIASRIYQTRNALVHSKSNDSRLKERGIYQPSKDKQELLKEIPLLRCIAESIVIHTATQL